MTTKTTLISHIFNEEYLLPFWLIHHKKIFDDLVIVNYRSTDKSIEICKTIWPECVIIETKNAWFAAEEVDREIMEIENTIEGIKMVLNTTEFLFCETPIQDLFSSDTLLSYAIKIISPYSKKIYNINNNHELFNNLLTNDVGFHYDRHGHRMLHNFPNGNYKGGRHVSYHRSFFLTNNATIIWLGFYPLNDQLLKRKLQIQQNIPQSDRDRGMGYQHLWDKDTMMSINNEKSDSGLLLKDINIELYNLISSIYSNGKNNIYYYDLLQDSKWGEDIVLLENDVNLLENTIFDKDGYKVFTIPNFNNFLQDFIKNEIKIITQKDVNLLNYHNEINESEHKAILSSMPYKKNVSPELKNFSEHIENYISTILGFSIKIFNDDIWFRICRPTNIYKNDFNPCHKDVYLDFYKNLINIYLPVVGSNENSSLKIEPGSHKWNENEIMRTTGGAFFKNINKKYSVDAIVATKTPLEMIRPKVEIHQMMIFSPYLIHGCSDNNNMNETRISLEVRFIRNDEHSEKQEHEFREFLKVRNWR